MTEPIAHAPDHLWTKFQYDRHRRRWYRHCVIGTGSCTAVESVARGMKPKKGSK